MDKDYLNPDLKQAITTFGNFREDLVEIIETRPPQSLHIVEYNPEWPERFKELQERIRQAIGDVALSIDHVGSTSVPGLPAKDSIDIDVIVADTQAEELYTKQLQAAGFIWLFRDPGWYQHRLFGLVEPHATIHFWNPGCPENLRHKLFRDYLKEHEEERKLYAEIKRKAAEASRDASETVMQYNFRKEKALREILERAFKANGLL